MWTDRRTHTHKDMVGAWKEISVCTGCCGSLVLYLPACMFEFAASRRTTEAGNTRGQISPSNKTQANDKTSEPAQTGRSSTSMTAMGDYVITHNISRSVVLGLFVCVCLVGS
jgi:hypothetical protein